MQAHQQSLKTPGLLISLSTVNQKLIFIIFGLFCLTPFAGPGIALLMGLLVAQLTGNPYLHLNHKATNMLLRFSVVGLGFGMNLHRAIEAGEQGFVFTIISITGTLLSGYLLGRVLSIEKKTSFLISSGTAICGGSAIAAISPVIKPEEKQISVALGCVFVLNGVALFIFPVIGHYFNLSQTQFGLWCAIAIHDTSSVIGAAGKYGPQAMEIATTVKLARALWIIPVTFVSSLLFKGSSKKVNIPYFIGLFILAVITNTYIKGVSAVAPYFVAASKTGLTLTLFLIGAGLSRTVLAAVGIKPFLQGTALWVMISAAALFAVMHLA